MTSLQNSNNQMRSGTLTITNSSENALSTLGNVKFSNSVNCAYLNQNDTIIDDDFFGSALTPMWTTAINGNSSITMNINSPSAVKLFSGSTTNSNCQLNFNYKETIDQINRNPIIEFKIKLDGFINNVLPSIFYIGVRNGTRLTVLNAGPYAIEWTLRSSLTTEVSTPLGVIIDAKWAYFKMEFIGGVVNIYHKSASTAVWNLKLANGAISQVAPVQPTAVAWCLSNSAINCQIDYFKVYYNRE